MDDQEQTEGAGYAQYRAYLAKVNESVAAAEQHLGVPPGTVSSIETDPDFVGTVKTYAVIEPILNDLIAWRPPKAMFEAFAPSAPDPNFQKFVAALSVDGRAGKLKLAEGLGLLAQRHIDFVLGVARIRNRYAHNVKNMHKSLLEMLTEEQARNARIVEHVTGLQAKVPDCALPNPFFKTAMYQRLADYLSDALNTLRPPELVEFQRLAKLLAEVK